jgi:hypothetical protein
MCHIGLSGISRQAGNNFKMQQVLDIYPALVLYVESEFNYIKTCFNIFSTAR